MAQKKFYITTTLPYVNAKPHIGFALEIVQADALARYRRLIGDEVFFNFGTDEHGQKIYQKALEEGKEPQAYTDEYAASFDALKHALNLSYDAFIRTTSPHHKQAAQEFWKRCEAAGDMYKKLYKIQYCVGCELEKTDSELEQGRCPLHPNAELETREEENYFFRFSKYQDALLKLYRREDFLIPRFRLNEMLSLIEREGLSDFSISRLAEKMPWGVPVPGDSAQVMYVWFDALGGYISTLGWPEDEKKFAAFWGTKERPNAVQCAGKDQVRQQGAMWQAMLMSAGLPTTKQIFIHGFLTSGGQKMSKSLGNVIDPCALVAEYGTDAVRYYLLRHAHPYEDSDITEAGVREAYNAHLANGLGNLVARVMKLAEDHLTAPVAIADSPAMPDAWKPLEHYEFNRSLDIVWRSVQDLDALIQEQKPFAVVKTDTARAQRQITHLVTEIARIAHRLAPFLPETSEKILAAVRANKKPETLFPRK